MPTRIEPIATAVLIAVTLAAFGGRAAGDPENPGERFGIVPEPADAEPVDDRDWYGWQIVPADLAVGALTMLDERFLYLHIGAGPAVHFVRGERLHGALSLAFRFAVPWLVGRATGAVAELECDDDERSCDNANQDGRFVGRAIGAVAVSLVDLVFLSRETPGRSDAISPTIAPTRGGATVGIVGSF